MKIKELLNRNDYKHVSNKEIRNGYKQLSSILTTDGLFDSHRRTALIKLKKSINPLPQSPQKETLLLKIQGCLYELLKNSSFYENSFKKLRQVETELLNTNEHRKILYTHFVLDSYADLVSNEEVAKPCQPILLLMQTIDDIIPTIHSDETLERFKQIKQSLETAFTITLFQEDFHYDDNLQFHKEYLSDILEQELDRLKSDPQSHLRPLFIPAQTCDHAVMLKIIYDKRDYFILTIVNTDRDSVQNKENRIHDICFTHIPKENLKTLPEFLLKEFKEYSSLLYDLKSTFSHIVQETEGALHKGQKGDSCSIKCVTFSLKQSLPNPLYRELKYTLTKRLNEENQDHPYAEFGLLVLNKRARKRAPLE